MSRYPQLNFPSYRFRVSDLGDVLRIWDELRRCWLVLTPEEWVRRHLIRFLVEQGGAAAPRISQEYPVCIQGMPQRADVVVFGRDGIPLLLAECKAPEVVVNDAVYAQAVRYNAVVGARYLVLTNGLRHYVYEQTETGYRPLQTFPDLHDETQEP